MNFQNEPEKKASRADRAETVSSFFYKWIEKNRTNSSYYMRRHKLFSKYDEGIKLNNEQWHSVTPEKVAKQVASRTAQVYPNSRHVIDAFGGAAGNTIQFALNESFSRVGYVEMNPEVFDLATNNARIYDVDQNIDFVQCNFFDYECEKDENIVIFASPPWGGTDYKNSEIWDMHAAKPSIPSILEHARKITPNICIFLPRNTSEEDLRSLRQSNESLLIEYLYLAGYCQGLCAYFNAKLDA